jgi:hypothetical protein
MVLLYVLRSYSQRFHPPRAARPVGSIRKPNPAHLERFKTKRNSLSLVRQSLHSVIRPPAPTLKLQWRDLSLSNSLEHQKSPNIPTHPTQQTLRNVVYTCWTSPILMRVGMEPTSEYSRNLHARKLLEKHLELVEYHNLYFIDRNELK